MWESGAKERKIISSSDSNIENLSMEAEVFNGFKFMLEIKDAEVPQAKTRGSAGKPYSHGNLDSPNFWPCKDCSANANKLNDCNSHDFLPQLMPTKTYCSIEKFDSSFIGSKSEKPCSRPLEIFEKIISSCVCNYPKLYDNETAVEPQMPQCFNTCYKSEKNKIDDDFDYSLFSSSSHPVEECAHLFKNKLTDECFNEHEDSLQIENDLIIADNTSAGRKHASELLKDKEEKSIEVIKIYKKAKIEDCEKVPSCHSINSDKVINKEGLSHKVKAKVDSKHTGLLAEDETFFRFDRRGWICLHCLNFNFESKHILSI